MCTLITVPPLFPKLPPIPVLTVSLWTDLKLFFQFSLMKMIRHIPTNSIFCTKIYLFPYKLFKCYWIDFSHSPDNLVSYYSIITLLGSNFTIYCTPKTIRSEPSNLNIIYFTFSFVGTVAFTFHVKILILRGLVYWQWFFDLVWALPPLWIRSIEVCLMRSMNFSLYSLCNETNELSISSRNLFFNPETALVPA